MDVSSLAAAMAGAQVGRTQIAMAAKMMKMNADSAASIIQVIEAAQQNLDTARRCGSGPRAESRHYGLSAREQRPHDRHPGLARAAAGHAAGGRAAPQRRRSGIPFWAIAVGAAALGFAIVLFTPRFYTMQRTAALPDVQSAQRPEPAESAPAQPRRRRPRWRRPRGAGVALCRQGARRGGRGPCEDAACDERAARVARRTAPGSEWSTRPRGREAALFPDRGAGALLRAQPEAQGDRRRHQLLQGHRIHQRGDRRRRQGRRHDGRDGVLGAATIDPRVVEAIEGLMRAGYLTKAHRDEIAANVPRELKDRFARIVGTTPPCPKPPWWASFSVEH